MCRHTVGRTAQCTRPVTTRCVIPSLRQTRSRALMSRGWLAHRPVPRPHLQTGRRIAHLLARTRPVRTPLATVLPHVYLEHPPALRSRQPARFPHRDCRRVAASAHPDRPRPSDRGRQVRAPTLAAHRNRRTRHDDPAPQGARRSVRTPCRRIDHDGRKSVPLHRQLAVRLAADACSEEGETAEPPQGGDHRLDFVVAVFRNVDFGLVRESCVLDKGDPPRDRLGTNPRDVPCRPFAH